MQPTLTEDKARQLLLIRSSNNRENSPIATIEIGIARTSPTITVQPTKTSQQSVLFYLILLTNTYNPAEKKV